ncbi:MAG: hypothetical protein JWM85_3494 [Acidimicrobiaceae bacterium]|nr:hypothetical protein [Acidimicrobiaceae bacterium]
MSRGRTRKERCLASLGAAMAAKTWANAGARLDEHGARTRTLIREGNSEISLRSFTRSTRSSTSARDARTAVTSTRNPTSGRPPLCPRGTDRSRPETAAVTARGDREPRGGKAMNQSSNPIRGSEHAGGVASHP